MADIVIMRHGEALPSDVDPTRGLSETGRSESIDVADRLAAAGVRVDRILHSGKKRAAETAMILAERLGRGARVERRAGLDPNDATEGIASELEAASDGVAVVGHLPHLEILLLDLVGKERAPKLGTSTAVRLARDGGGWTVVARIEPDR